MDLHSALRDVIDDEVVCNLIDLNSNETNIVDDYGCLLIFSAIAYRRSPSILLKILDYYPECAKCKDYEGDYALHRALYMFTSTSFSEDVLRRLLDIYPEACQYPDSTGVYPFHYVSISNLSIETFSIVLAAYPKAASKVVSNEFFDSGLPLHTMSDHSVENLIERANILLDVYPEACKIKDGDGDLPLQIFSRIEDIDCNLIRRMIQIFPDACSIPDSNGSYILHGISQHCDDKKLILEVISIYPDACKQLFHNQLPIHNASSEEIFVVLAKQYPEALYEKMYEHSPVSLLDEMIESYNNPKMIRFALNIQKTLYPKYMDIYHDLNWNTRKSIIRVVVGYSHNQWNSKYPTNSCQALWKCIERVCNMINMKGTNRITSDILILIISLI